ncbi:MAG: flagellar basal body-associated FliL family protein [Alphaproteobacteria bacterium]|nr:flagellar basal body-associated FliL family protein [Alphaproteobacteria bacterium]
MSEEDEDDAPVKRKVSGKKLVIFILLPVILICAAVGAAIALGLFDGLLGGDPAAEEEQTEEVAEPTIEPPGIFYEMEEMTVSLSGTGTRKNFLVLEVQLELEDPAAVQRMDQLRPKVVSEFNVFLRELRPEELNGSEGAYLVREELYRRVSQVLAPTPVKDLLLVKMLVQ